MNVDPNRYNCHPGYLRGLLEKADITPTLAARILLIDKRIFRHMLNGKQKVPFSIQLVLEHLAENPPQRGDINWDAVRQRFPDGKL